MQIKNRNSGIFLKNRMNKIQLLLSNNFLLIQVVNPDISREHLLKTPGTVENTGPGRGAVTLSKYLDKLLELIKKLLERSPRPI